jgi:flagellar protein FlaG
MDAALSFRAMHPQIPAQPRIEAVPVRAAVPTELPQPDKSVSATVEHSPQDGVAARPRNRAELPPEQRLSDEVLREIEREVEREVEYSDDAKTLIFTKKDGTSGQVLQQIPDERLLKMRAYVSQILDHTSSPPLVEREA